MWQFLFLSLLQRETSRQMEQRICSAEKMIAI
jgi:hypothetical protein